MKHDESGRILGRMNLHPVVVFEHKTLQVWWVWQVVVDHSVVALDACFSLGLFSVDLRVLDPGFSCMLLPVEK